MNNPNDPNRTQNAHTTPTPQSTQSQQIFEKNGKWGIGHDAQSAQYQYSSRQDAENALKQHAA